jgi:hypothetical protein
VRYFCSAYTYEWSSVDLEACPTSCGSKNYYVAVNVKCIRKPDNKEVAYALCPGSPPSNQKLCPATPECSCMMPRNGYFVQYDLLCFILLRLCNLVCISGDFFKVCPFLPTDTYNWDQFRTLYNGCSTVPNICGMSVFKFSFAVTCRRNDGKIVADSYCQQATRPGTYWQCPAPSCSGIETAY